VVGDIGDRGVLLGGEFAGAGDALVQDRQGASADRVGYRLENFRGDCRTGDRSTLFTAMDGTANITVSS